MARKSQLNQRQLRAIGRALSDPTRYDILKRVAGVQCAACADLREAFPVSPATLSHHLKELESAGLITTEKRGKFVDLTFQRELWEQYLSELKSF